MKKRTEQDDDFAARFTAALLSTLDKKTKSREHTKETFAESIGIERSQLFNYRLRPQVPSIRTIVLAFRNHGILVPYGGTELRKIARRQSKGKHEGLDAPVVIPLQIKSGAKRPVQFAVTGIRPRRLDVTLSIGGVKQGV